MSTQTNRCVYQVFGGYANWSDKLEYNCPSCIPDSLNLRCKYYRPVALVMLSVVSKTADLPAGSVPAESVPKVAISLVENEGGGKCASG